MNTYKIKSIFKNSLLIEYRKDNGDLVEFYIKIKKDWDKSKIEEEIAKQKLSIEEMDMQLNLDQYFSKGEQLEFVEVKSQEEIEEEIARTQQIEEQLLLEKQNQELLDTIIQYRNTPADYKAFRWQEYPSFEEQFDALYWMRQGIMEPIQELDKKIKAVKEKYPKNSPILTNADLDAAFPESRPTYYIEELKQKNIQADFLE